MALICWNITSPVLIVEEQFLGLNIKWYSKACSKLDKEAKRYRPNQWKRKFKYDL